jgi:hypothetical protein
MFRELYLSEHLSDYDIVLIAEDQPEPGPAARSPRGSRAILGHGAVLMGKSEYFKLKLQQPFGKTSRARAAAKGKPRLFVQVRAPPQLKSPARAATAISSHSAQPLSLPPRSWTRRCGTRSSSGCCTTCTTTSCLAHWA